MGRGVQTQGWGCWEGGGAGKWDSSDALSKLCRLGFWSFWILYIDIRRSLSWNVKCRSRSVKPWISKPQICVQVKISDTGQFLTGESLTGLCAVWLMLFVFQISQLYSRTTHYIIPRWEYYMNIAKTEVPLSKSLTSFRSIHMQIIQQIICPLPPLFRPFSHEN